MEKSWVMTEEERLQMLKNRLDKKKQQNDLLLPKVHSSNNLLSYTPDIKSINNYLNNQEVNLHEQHSQFNN